MCNSETSNLTDSFNAAASTYEKRMGTATRAVAQHIVQSLRILPHARICDNACGTGAITEAVFEKHDDSLVNAVDNSPGMINILLNISAEKDWGSRLKLDVADSIRLPYPDDFFDTNVMAFGIFFTSDAIQAAREIHRTLKPGGQAVVTCWKESALFKMVFEVQNIVQPAKPLQSLTTLEIWSKKETLLDAMTAGGFSHVRMEAFPVDLTGPTSNDLIISCAENFKGMVGDLWTKEEKSKIEGATEKILCTPNNPYLTVNTTSLKGIRWIAWIATATK